MSGKQILSSRDLFRTEQGTWIGITKQGEFAVLTNYRESAADDVDQNISGIRSRGRVVNGWLGGLAGEGISNGVHKLVHEHGVQGVGGFSMTCGRLRKKSNEGVAIVSNRAENVDDVPIVGKARGETWGLSNTIFHDPNHWPKIAMGKDLLKQSVEKAVTEKQTEKEFINSLLAVLDRNTFPELPADSDLVEYMNRFRQSIFVPAIGTLLHQKYMQDSRSKGKTTWEQAGVPEGAPTNAPFDSGLYGTQRQTVVLVDWEGNVTFFERALYDPNGNEIPRGEGDVETRFSIDGWDE